MGKSLITIFLVFSFSFLFGQSDTAIIHTVTPPNSEYEVYVFDSILETDILTYQYFNLWDFDNDGIMDSVLFVGNGGAHTYFDFNLYLSKINKWYRYKTILIDMPYYSSENKLNEMSQFYVMDFDKDGIDEIYINFDNGFGTIPKKLEQSVSTKRLIFDVDEGYLKVNDARFQFY